MEDNKYYTPEISEFHVGFEYEYKGDIKWHKYTYSVGDFIINGENRLNIELFNNQIRVKYLDKLDIENLGFIYKGKTIDNWYYMNGDFERSLSNHRNYSISIQHDFRDNNGIVIRGFEWSDLKGEEEVLYRGACKNKSELIKILRNINICKNNGVN